MVEIYLLIAAYIGLTIWLTVEGQKRNIGATRSFLFNLLLTPIIGFILVFNSGRRISYLVKQYKCPRCSYEFTEEQEYCPLCIKDDKKVKLEEVQKEMT
ncbi:MAG: hypothetical protein K9G67_08200 [Bacteroidales bacterium]|nr:hypothetical protein [Bacteroidales bacterium]MCF8350732.1 hypothetical protein [Bacteroidales bacterium]MCF8376319.1 hypothetical protein [Bacteroidales bacterium]MCF8401012.1 hypothetical protein [Bacteroidales bacterium]